MLKKLLGYLDIGVLPQGLEDSLLADIRFYEPLGLIGFNQRLVLQTANTLGWDMFL